MRRVSLSGWAAVLSGMLILGVLVAPATRASPSNVRVTTDDDATTSYVRYDGTSDSVTDDCSHGRRSQNEPTIAVDPHDPDVFAAGSNDYCTAIHTGDVWAGYYRSTNGGTTWSDSLVPGYPGDDSAGGLASPTNGVCSAAGDPTQSFDNDGRLFYGFICFNRSKPINGGLYVSRYLDDGKAYDHTVLVKRGTPSGLFLTGLFQDKINLVVDQTGGQHEGNVYVAWSQYDGFARNNVTLFSRSTNHGDSYSPANRVIPVAEGTGSYTDLAVGPDGTVYLTWLSYPTPSRPHTTVWLARSTDGGVSFQPAVRVANISLFDSSQFSGNGFSDCGDGPYACPSGLTFSRFSSNSAVAADQTGVHVVWSGRNEDGQAKVFIRSSPDGVQWTAAPSQLDSAPAGHQWFPDIASVDGGALDVVFYDSRTDPAYSPDLPPGNTASGTNSGDVVFTYLARSTDGGVSWAESQVSTAGSNFGWETHGSRRVGFWGDYIYISAVPGAVAVAWTDSRDLVPGVDPRETGTDDDQDGFDVRQNCTYVPNDINAPSYSSPTVDDPCLNHGGLDQNIYAASV
jgi:hypothetical protein